MKLACDELLQETVARFDKEGEAWRLATSLVTVTVTALATAASEEADTRSAEA